MRCFPELIDWARGDGVPMVTSQHVPPFGAMRAAVERARDAAGAVLTVTSARQLAAWGAAAGGNMRVVHNGVDTDRWGPAARRTDRALWYGRITPNKGLVEAARAARDAGAPLDVAGIVEDEAYFREAMAFARGADVRYHGQLQGDALRDLVAQARAVLVTPMWDEPFGLVAAEALACDVPVIGFDRGALAEVVGEGGRLVPAGDVAALAATLACDPPIAPGTCRARAVERFSLDAMLAGYEACYETAIAMSGVVSPAARRSSRSSSAALLA